MVMIATFLDTEKHTALKQLAKKEKMSIKKILKILVEKVLNNELLIADNQELFIKSNLEEIMQEEEKIDKELSISESIETNLLRINRKLEELENKLNSITNDNSNNQDDLKIKLIKSLLS